MDRVGYNRVYSGVDGYVVDYQMIHCRLIIRLFRGFSAGLISFERLSVRLVLYAASLTSFARSSKLSKRTRAQLSLFKQHGAQCC